MTTLFDYWNLPSVRAASYPALLEIAQCNAVTPMAIIADLHLDGTIDGIDALLLLRERLGRKVPGILVTADQSPAVKERAKATGIDYFSKPMKPAPLTRKSVAYGQSVSVRVDLGCRLILKNKKTTPIAKR